jgi:acyl carrier protein
MEFSPEALVHQLLASRLHIDEASIRDTDRLDDLGLTPLDLVLVVLRLDRFDRGDGEFPVYELEHATTVGHLVDLVELWLRRNTVPISVRGPLASLADATADQGRPQRAAHPGPARRAAVTSQ